MAFTADARSGFLWLQCFIADEEAWCHSIGCPGTIITSQPLTRLQSQSLCVFSASTRLPYSLCRAQPCPTPANGSIACVVTTTLSTEPHLRMTFTALKLAANKPSSCTSNDDLPSFSFFADALRTALETDPFWAPFHGTSSSVEASAEKLTSHIHALVSQCAEIESLVADYAASTSTTAPSVQSLRPALKTARTFPLRTPASPLLQRHGSPDCGKLPAVKPSRLARRQQRLRMEEQAILQKLVVQCWGKAALTGAIPGGRDRAYVRAERASRESAQASESDLDKRRRSLTCPQ